MVRKGRAGMSQLPRLQGKYGYSRGPTAICQPRGPQHSQLARHKAARGEGQEGQEGQKGQAEQQQEARQEEKRKARQEGRQDDFQAPPRLEL